MTIGVVKGGCGGSGAVVNSQQGEMRRHDDSLSRHDGAGPAVVYPSAYDDRDADANNATIETFSEFAASPSRGRPGTGRRLLRRVTSAPVGLWSTRRRKELPEAWCLPGDSEQPQLDNWPAKSASIGQTHSARTASRKPKLYADLELELNAQLRALALAGGGGGGGKSRADSRTTVDFRRLQAFRNVFDAVIQNFSAYRSLLALVKHEYEDALKWLTARVDKLAPYKARFDAKEKDRDNTIAEAIRKHDLETQNDAVAVSKLRDEIALLKGNEGGTDRTIQRLQEEVRVLNRRYCFEEASKKLLVDKCNELELYKEDTEASFGNLIAEQDTGKDYLQERRVHQLETELAAATEKLEADARVFAQVVPRDKYVAMQTRANDAEKQLAEITAEVEQLRGDSDELRLIHIKSKYENKVLYDRMRSYTPRPDWTKLKDIEQFQPVLAVKHSAQRLEHLLSLHQQMRGSGRPGFRRTSASPPKPPPAAHVNGLVTETRLGDV